MTVAGMTVAGMTVAGMTGFIGIGEQEGGSVEVMKKAGGRDRSS